jgi:outer membrane protein TolC
MIPLKKHCFGLVFCCLTTFVQAQVKLNSLEEVWAYADANNIELKTALVNKKIAATSIKQAYGGMLPSVTANAGFTDNLQIQSTLIPANLFNSAAPEGTYAEAAFGRRYSYNGNVVAEMDILNIQNWFAVKGAKLSDEMAALTIARTKKDLYGQLANSYFSCILLTEAEKLSRENLQAINTIYTVSANKFKDGLISEVTFNLAKINKEKAEKSLDVAVQNKLLQLNNLKLLLNSNDAIVVVEEFKEDTPIAPHIAFAPDPNVQMYILDALMSKNDWQSQKVAFVPTLSAVYQYSTLVAGDHFMDFDNTNTIPQQYWGLRLSLPIFTGNTRRYETQKAKLDYENKRERYDHAVLENNIHNTNLLIAYNSALQTYTKCKNILDLYQANDRHASQRMDEGIIPMDERLDFYSDMIIGQNDYLQSMSDYFIQQYRLKISQTNLIK